MLSNESIYDKAFRFAAKAHEGQWDKGGNPYIEHPKRVAARFTDDRLKAISLLHDIVEDSHVTVQEIAREFGQAIADEVEALTRRENEPYPDYIQRVAPRPLARLVKIADLKDNLELTRLKSVTPETEERLARYQGALEKLLVDEANDTNL